MLLSPDHKSIVGAVPEVEKERTKVRIVKGNEKRVFSKFESVVEEGDDFDHLMCLDLQYNVLITKSDEHRTNLLLLVVNEPWVPEKSDSSSNYRLFHSQSLPINPLDPDLHQIYKYMLLLWSF